jgi:hypothetical protein
MSEDLLQCDGRSEVAKGCVHLVVDLGAGVCLGYSACCMAVRPTARLKWQTVFYLLIVLGESWQVYEHFAASGTRRR